MLIALRFYIFTIIYAITLGLALNLISGNFLKNAIGSIVASILSLVLIYIENNLFGSSTFAEVLLLFFLISAFVNIKLYSAN